jgi:hypothetical protein
MSYFYTVMPSKELCRAIPFRPMFIVVLVLFTRHNNYCFSPVIMTFFC